MTVARLVNEGRQALCEIRLGNSQSQTRYDNARHRLNLIIQEYGWPSSWALPVFVVHEGIRKTVRGAWKADRGHSLLLEFRSQNPRFPNIAAYDLVPESEYQTAFHEYLSSGGEIFRTADIDQLEVQDWAHIRIEGVASQQSSRSSTKGYVLVALPDSLGDWYTLPDLIGKFGTFQVVQVIQERRVKTGQYIPIDSSSGAGAQRRRRITTAAPSPLQPTVPPMTDEELLSFYEQQIQLLRRRINGQAR